MILPNYVFDALKWICIVALPTLAVLYEALSGIWGFPYAEEIPKTITAIQFALGALLGVSSVQYYKDNGESLPMPDDETEVDNNERGEG